MSLTEGTGMPPEGWEPGEAAERIHQEAHSRREHRDWLIAMDYHGNLVNHCDYCKSGALRDRGPS